MTIDELNVLKNTSPMYTTTPVTELISLRDYFAGQALVGLLSNSDRSGTPAQYAEASLFYADALLKAREG